VTALDRMRRRADLFAPDARSRFLADLAQAVADARAEGIRAAHDVAAREYDAAEAIRRELMGDDQ
jgi:hypothetical protein